jgi:hypothetical protein
MDASVALGCKLDEDTLIRFPLPGGERDRVRGFLMFV